MVWYGMVTALEKKRETMKKKNAESCAWCCLRYSYMYVVLCYGFYYLEEVGLVAPLYLRCVALVRYFAWTGSTSPKGEGHS